MESLIEILPEIKCNMKKNTHPKYQQVLFVDSSTDYKFVCGSTLKTEETGEYNGKQYPMYRVSVSSASHPLFTGSKQLVDAEGRIVKFNKRYEAAQTKTNDQKAALEAKAIQEKAKKSKKK